MNKQCNCYKCTACYCQEPRYWMWNWTHFYYFYKCGPLFSNCGRVYRPHFPFKSLRCSSNRYPFRLKFHICLFRAKSNVSWGCEANTQTSTSEIEHKLRNRPVAVTLVSFSSTGRLETALCCKWRSRESHLGSNSSIGISRFPRYQKIQNTRLRKIMRGPEKTKKSQKLMGAKTPTKKRMRPAASRKTATKKNSRQRPR